MTKDLDDQDINNGTDELFEHFRYVADPGQGLLRVDKFLFHKMEGTSRSKIQNAAESGCIFVNDKAVKSNYKIKPHDEVVVKLRYPRRELELIPEDIPLNIVYEDDQVIVINKEPGMVVHPGHGNYTGTLLNALAWYFKDLEIFQGKDNTRAGLVHRIDKNTSGLLVVAKTEHAKTHLGKQFFNKSTHRIYHALVWGRPKEDPGTVVGYIGRNPKDRTVMFVFDDEEKGRHAVTHYKILEDFSYITLLECKLETGRTHQIRVHLKSIGHPLFNDKEYGGDLILKGTTFTKYKQFVQNCFKVLPRQALHAKELGFVHPTSGEWMLFNSEIPDDMKEVMEKWKVYLGGR